MLLTYVPRIALALGRGLGKPRLGPLDEARLPLRVGPADVDPYLHLNNGRYLTLMDIGRWQLTQRIGLLELFVRNSWWPVLGAASIGFRRELKLFQRFELTTRIAGWDGKWFWFEQRFEVGSQVHARAEVKGVIRHAGKSLPMDEVMAALGAGTIPSPPIPEPAGFERAAR